MYYASTHTYFPKRRVHAELKTTDGERFYGTLFLSGDQRIKDLLCGHEQFIPFVGPDDEFYLFNRETIANVAPLEMLDQASDQWRPGAFKAAGGEARVNGHHSYAAESVLELPSDFDIVEPEAAGATVHHHGVQVANLAAIRRRDTTLQFATWVTAAIMVGLLGFVGSLALEQYSPAPPEPEVQAANYSDGAAAFQRGDYAAARTAFEALAEDGHAKAQIDLGFMYTKGFGGSRHYGKALSWYRKAADQGDPEGQFRTGLMHRNGFGTGQNYVRAHMWFSLAAAQGHPTAGVQRDQIARKMSNDDLAEAQRLERGWRKRH